MGLVKSQEWKKGEWEHDESDSGNKCPKQRGNKNS